ncbi:MAG: cytochrome P450 [Gammaproteobacteria bacterium]
MAIELISNTVQTTPKEQPEFPSVSGYAPEVNLLDLQLFTQGPPHSAFKKMREQGPICWHHGANAAVTEDTAGFWNLVRYKDIQDVSKDTSTFSSQLGSMHIAVGRAVAPEVQPLFAASFNNMICMDGDWHKDLRSTHNPFFTNEEVQKIQTRIEHKVTQILDDMAPLGECDLVENFSQILPLYTLSQILGIPEEDEHRLAHWMHYLEIASYISTAGMESVGGSIPDNFVAEFLDVVKEMLDYGRFQFHNRRKSKQDDLLSAIAWAQLEESLLSDEYLDGSWLLIVFAGNDTTRNTLSGTTRLLTENPEQKQKVLDNPELLPNMVEEAIRMISPVMHMRRTATRETQIGEQRIGQNEKVVMWYGAGNRDPEIFPNPDQFDIERSNANKQIAFGFGKHMCIGHRVARMQLQCAYKQLLQRFPDLEWTGEIEIAPNNFVHAIRKMPVRFKPRKS